MAPFRLRRLLAGTALVAGTALSASERRAAKSGNMNGKYSVASGDKQDVAFNDDYASKGHNYFDVWSPEIATHYGEVFWTDMGDQHLPDEIRKHFAGKVMAITGYEQDQVMVQPAGQPGQSTDQDASVPINWAYNHHYMAWLTGAHSDLIKVPAAPGDPMAHGATTKWIAIDRPSAALREDPTTPTSQMFSEGNGGESRKSFHGYPNGFAQLIDSPTTWHITPMQIDTRNRDCGVTPADVGNCTKFTPGPEPRQARYGRGIPKEGTNLSGLVECPCTGRYGGDPLFYGKDTKTKQIDEQFMAVSSGTCTTGQSVVSAAECFDAVAKLGIYATSFTNKTVDDSKLPSECSVVTETDGSATAYYNSATQGSHCDSGTKRIGQGTSPVNVTLHLSLDGAGLFERSSMGSYCDVGQDIILKEFVTASGTFVDAYNARDACEKHCLGDENCWGCSANCRDAPLVYGRLFKGCQWNAISSCDEKKAWAGKIHGDVSAKQADGGVVTITLTGPANAWFGAGLNATQMRDLPYALIVSDSGVLEQKLGTCGDEGDHCPGDRLAPSVKVVSNTVENGMRTVVMTRSMQGLTKDHYSFDLHNTQTMHVITSVGNTQTFAYHKAHGPIVLSLTAAGTATCVCDLGTTGVLCEIDGTGCGQFVKDCSSNGTLVRDMNPTCSSGTYIGGLSCCGHKRILLDADQEIRPELLRYHMKFRFWYQEFKKPSKSSAPSHSDLARIYYQTESNAGEYDLPPAFALPGHPIVGYPHWPENQPTPGTTCTGTCPNGPDCDCIHTLSYHWEVSNMRLIYLGGHCHAPSCLSIDLYRNDTGTPQLICHQGTKYGGGNVTGDKWDEAQFIALPPCLFSDDPSEGLEPTTWLGPNTPLFSVKKNRNTIQGHYGEMASWQMRGVYFPKNSDDVFV